MRLSNAIQSFRHSSRLNLENRVNPFEQLPNELINTIFEYLFYSDLFKLRTIDHRFCEIANFALNKKYFLGFQETIFSCREIIQSRMAPFLSPNVLVELNINNHISRFDSILYEALKIVRSGSVNDSEGNLQIFLQELHRHIDFFIEERFLAKIQEYIFALKCARLFISIQSNQINIAEKMNASGADISDSDRIYINKLMIEYPNKLDIPLFLKGNLEDERLKKLEYRDHKNNSLLAQLD